MGLPKKFGIKPYQTNLNNDILGYYYNRYCNNTWGDLDVQWINGSFYFYWEI